MTEDDRRHGTYAGSQQHLRDNEDMCPPCHRAFRAYQKRHANERLLGRRRTMPSAPVTRHLKTLVDQGMTTQTIADRSGVGRATVQDLISRPRDRVRTDNGLALMQIAPAGVSTGSVPSIGTIRRVRALGRLGWSMPAIVRTARRLDPDLTISAGTLRQLLHDRPDIIRHRTAVAVSLAYEELSMSLPEPGHQTSQVRSRAARKGWPPPLCWDDIDDPDAVPHAGYREPDRADILHDLDELQAGISETCRRLGISREAVQKWCENHGMNDVYSRMVHREFRGFTGNQHREAS